MKDCEFCGVDITHKLKYFPASKYCSQKCMGKSKRLDVDKAFNERYTIAPNGCWEWTSYKSKKGYGTIFTVDGTILAHRYSWEKVNGPIPKGLFACHRCDNPSCCNPDHIFIGTQMENIQDCVAKGRRNTRKGTAVNTNKLTEEQVLRVFYDTRLAKEVAKDFGISHYTVAGIRLKKSWKHLLKDCVKPVYGKA